MIQRSNDPHTIPTSNTSAREQLCICGCAAAERGLKNKTLAGVFLFLDSLPEGVLQREVVDFRCNPCYMRAVKRTIILRRWGGG